MKKFTSRRGVWVLYFYDSTENEDLKSKETFLDFFILYSDLIEIAAVNCHKEKMICIDNFNVGSLPLIKGFSENKTTRGLTFTKILTVKNLAHFANFLTKNVIVKIKMADYQGFIKHQPNKFKILVFTNKTYPTFLLKSLALSLSKRVKFGLVNGQETELIEKFDINIFPSLVIVFNPARFQGLKYEGDFKKDSLLELFDINPKDRYRKIKHFSRNILHLSKDAVKKGFCGEEYEYFCFILITARMTEKQNLFLKKLLKFYEGVFFFVNSNEINYVCSYRKF